jgi:Mg-chelatase subunit ChlD
MSYMVTRTGLSMLVATTLLAVVALPACSSPSDISSFNKSQRSSEEADAPTGGDNGLGKTPSDAKQPTPLDKCATQSATAEARPVSLVFMFDKSGSMTSGGSPKWAASKTATKAFFESPQSKGLSASLAFFPDASNGDACSTGTYAAPRVPMYPLPHVAFGQWLDAQTPAGGTPTKPALQGALEYARQIQSTTGKDGKVAVVLVTDGQPNDCSSSVNNVSDLAKSASGSIPTYVIGVGSELEDLNQVAEAGGTQRAFIVTVNNAAQIQADFAKAIEQIKSSALSCDYKIPAAPAGETFDRTKVNVQHTPTGAALATLSYDQTCAAGAGWKYDDAANPTSILLCPTSCESVKSGAGRVDIVFGCATQTGPVK